MVNQHAMMMLLDHRVDYERQKIAVTTNDKEAIERYMKGDGSPMNTKNEK